MSLTSYQKMTVLELKHGQVLDTPSWFLKTTQSPSVQNCFHNDKTKELEKSPGYAIFKDLNGDPTADHFRGCLGNYGNAVDLAYINKANGAGRIAYITANSLTTIATDLDDCDNTSCMRWIQLGIYAVTNPDGTAAHLVAYKSDDNTAATIAAAPAAFAIAQKWGRMFAFSGQTVRWSDLWTHTTWPSGNTQTLSDKEPGDVRQVVEMACCLYIFCQFGVYKMYYVGGDAYVYIELISPFEREFLTGSAVCVTNKRIYFATAGDLFYTDGLNVYEYEEGNKSFYYEYTNIANTGTNPDLSWYIRQATFYEPYNLYLLPVKTSTGAWNTSTATFKVIAFNIVDKALWVWDWDMYAMNKSRGVTGSDMIMISAHGDGTDYATSGLDTDILFKKSGYNFNAINYDSNYQTGLIPIDGNLDTDKKVMGVELIIEGTGNWNLTVSKGNELGWNLTTHTVTLSGIGAIATVTAAPTVAGTGYTVGDVLTVVGGSGDATVTVATITGGGATGPVGTISLTTAGTSGYKIGTGNLTTGGTGIGCTVAIATIVEGGITRKYVDFAINCKLFRLKIANNTKDQNYKIIGFIVYWLPGGERR